jgi:inosine-uridine nucleoside N-ribohydrolase
MTQEQYLKNLTPPHGRVDVVMDTDAYTEIDDLYAIAYMLKHTEKFNIKGICAAPFIKPTRAATPKIAMEKSYDEITFLLKMMGREDIPVYYGSTSYLLNENTPVESPAADFYARLANSYSPERPLYILAIGSIPNVASAILKNPKMIEKCVVIWLGGHATHLPDGVNEYNMRQDIAGARIVFGCGIPLVHLPCNGTVDRFLTTKHELAYWLKGKNKLCNYLYERTVNEAEQYAKGRPWSRVIWDVTTVAWLLNEKGQFLKTRLTPSPIPGYNMQYTLHSDRHLICSVYQIERDALFADLFDILQRSS